MAQTKRYIVTFVNRQVEEAEAAQVLQVKRQSIADGIRALLEEPEIKAGTVLHFGNIGASVIEISDETAHKLRRHERVAEVVEDFEVFALGRCSCGCACCSGGDDSELTEAAQQGEELDAYLLGYQRGLADASAYGADPWAGSSPLTAARPRPARPALTPCPPGTVRRCYSRPGMPPRCICVSAQSALQPAGWNIRMVRAQEVWWRVRGTGIKVGVIDTGIDNDHPDLSVSGGASFVPGVTQWNDDNGHGTHCAGIIGARNNAVGVVGVAPGCSLYAVKVLNSAGSGQLSWILAGMGWCAQNGMHVASMSLGSPAEENAACVLAYQRAAEQLIEAGCIVIAAAGNSGQTSLPWVGQPARCVGFMAVAALDANRNLAPFSSRGPASLRPDAAVEIAAPGVTVNSTYIGNTYRELSGTSMACPHVSGAAALLKELHPTWTPAQIRARLKSTATDLGAPGTDVGTGAGLLDCYRAVFG
jgi:subtilisin